jgi:hypothetical protein
MFLDPAKICFFFHLWKKVLKKVSGMRYAVCGKAVCGKRYAEKRRAIKGERYAVCGMRKWDTSYSSARIVIRQQVFRHGHQKVVSSWPVRLVLPQKTDET